jgi:hypothetical protein
MPLGRQSDTTNELSRAYLERRIAAGSARLRSRADSF